MNIIVAKNLLNGIGYQGGFPWKTIHSDLLYFKNITTYFNDDNIGSLYSNNTPRLSEKQNVVIMGRRTWESIGKKPLKNRLNIVISRSQSFIDQLNESVMTFSSLSNAYHSLQRTDDISEIFIIGGSELYHEALIQFDIKRIFITEINSLDEADTFFPPFDEANYTKLDYFQFKDLLGHTAPYGNLEENEIQFSFSIYEKK